MSQRMARRIIAAGILAAALLVVGSAEAAGKGDWRDSSPGLFEKAWSWVLGFFTGVDPSGEPHVYQQDGICIDPNGAPSLCSAAAVTSAPTCSPGSVQGDDGICIDPNG
jgi:hypothetical protein